MVVTFASGFLILFNAVSQLQWPDKAPQEARVRSTPIAKLLSAMP